ncbi:hypothetical protein FOXB_15351, partial [Fusarium oxysporum f. sp. conglutinans Fo5176]
EYY